MRHENAYGPTPLPPVMGHGRSGRLLLAFFLAAFASSAWAQCPTEIEVVQPISCSGADDGVLTVSVPDGEDPDAVYWLFESDTLFGAVQGGLGPGSYLAFVPGCGALGINVNEPFPFFITAEIDVLPTCDDPCSGQITATPNFGQAPFAFNWSHDAAETGPVGTGVCEQIILVSATDANGCTDDAIVTVDIPEVEVLTFSTDPSCNGFDDGTASAVATGGLGGSFSFAWTDVGGNAVGSGADITGLAAGTYIVTATDAGGCSMSGSVTLNDPPPVNVDVTATGVSCAGDVDGSATAVFAGATLFAWSGPGGYADAGPALSTITDLGPGTYTVVVTAADGCVGEGTVDVPAPLPLDTEPFSAAPSCPGDDNGTVGVVPSGGTPPYTVIWSLPGGGEFTGEFFNGASAGEYLFLLTDDQGCTTTGSVTLDDPDPLSVSLSITPPDCAQGEGSDNGMLEAEVTGGVPPHLGSWVDVSTAELVSNGLIASNLGPGVYAFGVMDVAGCTLDTTVVLEAPDALSLSVTVQDPTCFGESDGAAEATVAGGTPGYSVTWAGDVAPTLALSISNLGAGSYTVEAVDAAGCVADSAFVLVEPDAIEVTTTVTDVGCSGDDGTLSATVSGGVPDFSVSWSGPGGLSGVGEEATGLTPGTYALEVVDANGCMAATAAEVGELPLLVLSADLVVADCETGQGNLTWSGTGGEPPLEAGLMDAGGELVDPAVWSSLPPGDYALFLEDNRGCVVDTTFSLNPPIVLDAVAEPAGCGGLGGMVATASGGAANFVWSLTPATAPSASDAVSAEWEDLAAGDYAVTADDGTCTRTVEVTVEGVDLFDWTVTTVDFACDSAPGGISVVLAGGAEPLVYSGSSTLEPITWASADTVGLPAGTYAVHVSDAAGCERDTVVELLAAPPLALSASVMPISCNGAADGAIELEATGGTEPYQYGAQGPMGLIPAPLTELSPGTYIAGVVDGRGCVADTVLGLVDPAPIVATSSVTAESCPGTADGQVSIQAEGGTGPIVLQWVDGPQDSLWTGLTAGVYVWTATDSMGCDTTGAVEVLAGLGPMVIDTVVAGPCMGGVPSADVQLIVSGDPDLAEVLLGGLPADQVSPTDSGAVWTWLNLAEGDYGWTVAVGESCGSNGTVSVELASPLEWIGAVTPPTCEGDSGQVVGITSGGTGLVTTSWTGVSLSGDTLSGDALSTGPIPSGEYAFFATDDAGCAVDTTVTLSALSMGLALDADMVQPTCGGALVGEATLLPSGGLPPYSVVVEGAADTVFLPFLLTGSYPVTLTDSVGCAVVDTLTIDPASAFVLTAEVDSASCANSEDGQIVLVPMDATGSVDYTFVGPFGATAATDTIAELGAGVYEITGLDEAGCPAVLLVSVGAPDPVIVALDSLDRPSCIDDADGALVASGSGGTGDADGWSVQWTLDGTAFDTGWAVDSLMEGVYAVVATDAAGCTGEIASIPLVAEGDVVLMVPGDTVLCSGQALTLSAEATGASTTSWSVADTLYGPGLVAGVEEVKVGTTVWVYTASRLGCVRQDTVEVTGLGVPEPNAGADQIVPEGSPAALGAGAQTDWTYSWFPPEEVVDPDQAATATQSLFATTEFVLTAISPEGCAASDTVLVEVLNELDIPSGFTPNDDGVNDRWNLGGLDQYPSAEITVFNRWGDILFSRGASDGPWDGTLEGIPVPVGTYYYHIRVNEPAMQAEWTGPITLMR